MDSKPSGIGTSNSMSEGWRAWRKSGEILTACQSMMLRILVGLEGSTKMLSLCRSECYRVGFDRLALPGRIWVVTFR